MAATGWFDQAWYSQRIPHGDADGDLLVHYLKHGAARGIGPSPYLDALGRSSGADTNPPGAVHHPRATLRAEVKLLAASGLFDADHYLACNPDVAAKNLDPLRHFCKRGWRQLRNPSPHFDVWWYWSCHLDPAQDKINPLTHYALLGQRAGLSARMPPYAPAGGHVLSRDSEPARICLVAGYDPDGMVDDYVVDLVRELSRFAEVYYLADCVMRDGQLERLAPWTRGSWAYRHDTYDFGSWSALANRHVGWDAIGRADELLLVNDSSYLVGPLAPVFEKMQAKACDWWGLQATKGMFATRHSPSNASASPIPMQRVRTELVDRYREDDVYDFHVGSYFIAFRTPVLADSGFRRRLGAVRAQGSKRRLIRKYEIGLTQYLIGSQYAFETFIDELYPLHPVFSNWHFVLLEKGLPLFKRFFLVMNHYDVPGLADWRAKLRAVAPDAPIQTIERNLSRATDHEKLHRSFSIIARDGRVDVPCPLDDAEFAKEDARLAKTAHWWAFVADPITGGLGGNERAVLDAVIDDPSIKKIVLTRWRSFQLAGKNVVHAPLRSPEGQSLLLRARCIFSGTDDHRAIIYPVSPEQHDFVDPYARFLHAIAAGDGGRTSAGPSSGTDAIVMRPGLPRWNIVLHDEARLPRDLREECDRLRRLLGDRRLALLVSRADTVGPVHSGQRTRETVDSLHGCMEQHGAVLGVRERATGAPGALYDTLRGPRVLDLAQRRFPLIDILFRLAEVLVSDDAEDAYGFLPTARPFVKLANDGSAVEGPNTVRDEGASDSVHVCGDWSQLTTVLDRVLCTRSLLAGHSVFGEAAAIDHANPTVAAFRGLHGG